MNLRRILKAFATIVIVVALISLLLTWVFLQLEKLFNL